MFTTKIPSTTEPARFRSALIKAGPVPSAMRPFRFVRLKSWGGDAIGCQPASEGGIDRRRAGVVKKSGYGTAGFKFEVGHDEGQIVALFSLAWTCSCEKGVFAAVQSRF